jgi:hypothetical protein
VRCVVTDSRSRAETWRLRCRALFALGVLSSACFDVQQVDVPADLGGGKPMVIDDFEDGDSLPNSPLLGRWFCLWSHKECGVSSPGANYSFHAYSMAFELIDPENGQPDYPSAELRTWRPSERRLDFSHYQSLVFSARLVPVQKLPSGTALVMLSCPGGGDSSDAISNISSGVQLSDTWLTYKLLLADFSWKSFYGPQVERAVCLTQIDGLGFHLQATDATGANTLLDGQTAAGTLIIDDVYLQ